MPLLDISPNVNANATGNLQFYRDGFAPSTGFQVDTSGNITTAGTVTSAGSALTGATTITGSSATGLLVVTNTTAATPGTIVTNDAAAANVSFAAEVTGDTNARFTIGADGKHQWGPGTGATDTDLFRYASGGLATDSVLKLNTAATLLFGSAGDTSLARAAAGQLNFSNPGSAHTSVLAADGTVLVGTTTALGDNGQGELQLANATAAPTTNPTGGATIYSVSGAPYVRDPRGAVLSLVTDPPRSAAPTGALAETINRCDASATLTPASGSLYIAAIWLPAGTSVGHVGFVSDTTAASGPTHWWAAVLDNTYKQQAHSADQTTAAIAASTWFSLAMATPYVTTYSGIYYLALTVVTSTTQPTFCAAPAPRAAMITGTGAITPLAGGVSTTGLTTPGTDGTTTYAAPTAASAVPYLYAAA